MTEKRYVGTIWVGPDKKAFELDLYAIDAEDAMRKVAAQWGDGHEYTLWNPEDATKPRGCSQ